MHARIDLLCSHYVMWMWINVCLNQIFSFVSFLLSGSPFGESLARHTVLPRNAGSVTLSSEEGILGVFVFPSPYSLSGLKLGIPIALIGIFSVRIDFYACVFTWRRHESVTESWLREIYNRLFVCINKWNNNNPANLITVSLSPLFSVC